MKHSTEIKSPGHAVDQKIVDQSSDTRYHQQKEAVSSSEQAEGGH